LGNPAIATINGVDLGDGFEFSLVFTLAIALGKRAEYPSARRKPRKETNEF